MSNRKLEYPCCGGVWSNFLQCYTGHYNDCKVWLAEEAALKALDNPALVQIRKRDIAVHTIIDESIFDILCVEKQI
jgi:hypothetical protein